MKQQQNEIILYHPDNSVGLEVVLENETVWLNRQQMAILFDRDIKTIGKHINNALKEELAEIPVVANFAITEKNPTIAKFATVQIEGNREVVRNIEYYNLDVILSVGYRVKSNYHIGASLKDLGKKLFAFSKMEIKANEILKLEVVNNNKKR